VLIGTLRVAAAVGVDAADEVAVAVLVDVDDDFDEQPVNARIEMNSEAAQTAGKRRTSRHSKIRSRMGAPDVPRNEQDSMMPYRPDKAPIGTGIHPEIFSIRPLSDGYLRFAAHRVR